MTAQFISAQHKVKTDKLHPWEAGKGHWAGESGDEGSASRTANISITWVIFDLLGSR